MSGVNAPNWRNWFFQAWPTLSRRVAEEAVEVGRERKLFLADMALRGKVFSPIMENDPIALARAEGRRQMALETIALCNMNPSELIALIERKPKEGTGQ